MGDCPSCPGKENPELEAWRWKGDRLALEYKVSEGKPHHIVLEISYRLGTIYTDFFIVHRILEESVHKAFG